MYITKEDCEDKPVIGISKMQYIKPVSIHSLKYQSCPGNYVSEYSVVTGQILPGNLIDTRPPIIAVVIPPLPLSTYSYSFQLSHNR